MSHMGMYELKKIAKGNTKACSCLTRWMPFTEKVWKKFGGKIMSLTLGVLSLMPLRYPKGDT